MPPQCTGTQHTTGSWRPATTTTFDDPPCCGWDNNHFQRDPEHCGTRRWHYRSGGMEPIYEPNGSWPIMQIGGSACTCKGFVDRHEWRPTACRLPRWSAARFCAALGNRSLLFVGDSTMEQLASSMMGLLQWGSAGGDACGGCACQLRVAPSDTLLGRNLGRYNRGYRLVDVVRRFSPDVVVAGAGAHVYGDANFSRVLEGVAALHARYFPNAQLIWRTSAPAGCGPAPLSAPPDEQFWALLATQTLMWNWREQAAQDEAARDFWSVRQSGRSPTRLLDLSPLHLRPDAHVGSPRSGAPWPDPAVSQREQKPARDCLHMCHAGPLGRLAPVLLMSVLEERAGRRAEYK